MAKSEIALSKADKKLYDQLKDMTPGEQAEFIRKGLNRIALERPSTLWLPTDYHRLNAVLGSRELGLSFGKVHTLAGKPSSGKTLIALKIAGWAQKACKALVGWVGIENSFDPKWAKLHGLDPGKKLEGGGYSKIALFEPEFGEFKADKKNKHAMFNLRMEYAEELFDRAESWAKLQRKIFGKDVRMVMVVDSVTAAQPKEEVDAGFSDQNMRTKLLAPFLNRLAKSWTALAPNLNMMVIFISQLRTNPMQMFGNPEYMPGGNGILFYPHNISWVRRVKKGVIMQNGSVAGVISSITNYKNKVGGGSREGKKCAFMAYFDEPKFKVMSVDKAKKIADKLAKGGGGGKEGEAGSRRRTRRKYQ